MKAIISTTYDDTYLFYLPLTVWAWNKLGVDCIVFVPTNAEEWKGKKIDLIVNQKWHIDLGLQWRAFDAAPDKEATYAQCSRLFAGCLRHMFDEDEILITSDIDMAVFNAEYFSVTNDNRIHVFGTDLVPDGQYPMCYVAMPAKTWRDVMRIGDGHKLQAKLDDLLGHLDCEHFRGNYWAKDQETIYNQITGSAHEVVKHCRAKPGTQFASRRADRDGWPLVIRPDIIDAHLPRPGYTEENFAKIMNLFTAMYPNDDLQWMVNYRNAYVKLLANE